MKVLTICFQLVGGKCWTCHGTAACAGDKQKEEVCDERSHCAATDPITSAILLAYRGIDAAPTFEQEMSTSLVRLTSGRDAIKSLPRYSLPALNIGQVLDGQLSSVGSVFSRCVTSVGRSPAASCASRERLDCVCCDDRVCECSALLTQDSGGQSRLQRSPINSNLLASWWHVRWGVGTIAAQAARLIDFIH